MSDSKDLTIDLTTAKAYAKKWRDPAFTYDYRSLHGFLISKEILQGLLDQTIDASRAYVGVNDIGEATLMIVGTKFNAATGTQDDMLPGSANPGKIFDFTRPCPRSCGYMSPLNDLTL